MEVGHRCPHSSQLAGVGAVGSDFILTVLNGASSQGGPAQPSPALSEEAAATLYACLVSWVSELTLADSFAPSQANCALG